MPILVGSTDPTIERRYGALLAPYLADPASVFVVSSDFCHWGSRFRYTRYEPRSGQAISLRSGDGDAPRDPPIHASIAAVDARCIDAVESGGHERFLDVLDETQNTVCGRHPIGVVMAAIEALRLEDPAASTQAKGRFKFVRYERSSLCSSVRDSSVSYCSAFAVF